MAWLPLSVISKAVPRGEVGEHGWECTGWDIFKPSSGFNEDAGRESLRLLEWINQRAEPEFCQRELGRLKVLTRERNLSQPDLVAQIALYAEGLTEYPPDVARDTCRSWAQTQKWFPSWTELRAGCEERAMKRREYLTALRRYFAGQAA